MSNDYKYQGEPLFQKAAMDILKRHSTKDESIKKGSSIAGLIETVRAYHEKYDGLPAKGDDLERKVIKALRSLSVSGHANEVSKNRWRLPKPNQRIFGYGKNWVYLYYFNVYKLYAELMGENVWKCKIGSTKKEPGDRVREQVKGTPEPALVVLLIRTDKHEELEKEIHRILKLRDRQLKESQGREWFTTNPDEVIEIYDFIIHEDQRYTKRRENLHARRAERERDRQLALFNANPTNLADSDNTTGVFSEENISEEEQDIQAETQMEKLNNR